MSMSSQPAVEIVANESIHDLEGPGGELSHAKGMKEQLQYFSAVHLACRLPAAQHQK